MLSPRGTLAASPTVYSTSSLLHLLLYFYFSVQGWFLRVCVVSVLHVLHAFVFVLYLYYMYLCCLICLMRIYYHSGSYLAAAFYLLRFQFEAVFGFKSATVHKKIQHTCLTFIFCVLFPLLFLDNNTEHNTISVCT